MMVVDLLWVVWVLSSGFGQPPESRQKEMKRKRLIRNYQRYRRYGGERPGLGAG